MTKKASPFAGTLCPACGARGLHEWNGQSGRGCSYGCTACGEQWDAADYERAGRRKPN